MAKPPFPQYDKPGSKISPWTGKPYTDAEKAKIHAAVSLRDKQKVRGSAGRTPAIQRRLNRARELSRENAKGSTDNSSPYRKWATQKGKKFQPDTNKSVYREYVGKQKAQGKTPLWFDDMLGHKARQAKYAENKRKAGGNRRAKPAQLNTAIVPKSLKFQKAIERRRKSTRGGRVA